MLNVTLHRRESLLDLCVSFNESSVMSTQLICQSFILLNPRVQILHQRIQFFKINPMLISISNINRSSQQTHLLQTFYQIYLIILSKLIPQPIFIFQSKELFYNSTVSQLFTHKYIVEKLLKSYFLVFN